MDFNGVGRTGGCGRSALGRTGSRRPGEPDGDVSRAAAPARRSGADRARQGPLRVTCSACHGADLRGGDWAGPNLLRSQVVLSDQQGELILPIVHGARAERACRRCRCPTRRGGGRGVHPQRAGDRRAAGRAAGERARRPRILVGDAGGRRGVLRGEVQQLPFRRQAICRASPRAFPTRKALQKPGSRAARGGAAAGAAARRPGRRRRRGHRDGDAAVRREGRRAASSGSTISSSRSRCADGTIQRLPPRRRRRRRSRSRIRSTATRRCCRCSRTKTCTT